MYIIMIDICTSGPRAPIPIAFHNKTLILLLARDLPYYNTSQNKSSCFGKKV